VESFFADPVRTGAQISGDGTRLGYLAPEGGRLNVWVEPVGGGEAVCVTHDRRRNVRNFRWTGDPRWLLYLQDDDGDECWHVFRADLEDPAADAVELTPFPGVTVELMLLASDPALAHITMNLRRPDELDVHRLNIVTGEIELVAQNPGHVSRWVLGPSGAIFAVTIDADLDETVHRWDDGVLTPLHTYPGPENPSCGPWSVLLMQATTSGDGLLIASNKDSEHTRLIHVSSEDGVVTLVSARDGLSVDHAVMGTPVPPPLIQSRSTGEVLAVRYQGERQLIEVLDPEFGEVLAAVEQLSDGEVGAISSDVSGRTWVVTFTHDTDPGVTYLYDHETGESRLLFRPYPHLDPSALAPVQPVSITSRDGLALTSYLTLPVGVEPTGLPLVLLVHGGPWSRDRWGYNPMVQLLANRGCAVLQVNFRGSTGSGKSFTRAAVGEFAGAMHDDLVDAAEWAVKQGYADPTRVALFGGSYGGYSALVGATFTPDVFACVVDYVGISDLAAFMATVPPQWSKFMANSFVLYCGDPADPEQRAELLARSPISRVDAVTRPVLVIQGARDPRVVRAESDNVVAALQEKGADVEYLLLEDEGHGCHNAKSNITVFRTIEQFLARTIGSHGSAA
jgi:dipeptidyl aminopeptidase/acylaminoacyl peptidase